MHDAVSLESLSTPTAVIVTDRFLGEARTQRDALGMVDLEPVTITHPLSTLTDAQIAERVAEALPRVRAAWLDAAGADPG